MRQPSKLRQRPTTKRRSGFSFLEVLIVVLVIGILAAVAAPRFADSVDHYNSLAAGKRVVADLMYAREDAQNSGKSVTIVFSPTGDQYEMPTAKSPQTKRTGYLVDLSALAYPALLDSADFEGSQSVTFDVYGMPNASGTVVVSSGSHQVTVVLDSVTGIARLQ